MVGTKQKYGTLMSHVRSVQAEVLFIALDATRRA